MWCGDPWQPLNHSPLLLPPFSWRHTTKDDAACVVCMRVLCTVEYCSASPPLSRSTRGLVFMYVRTRGKPHLHRGFDSLRCLITSLEGETHPLIARHHYTSLACAIQRNWLCGVLTSIQPGSSSDRIFLRGFLRGCQVMGSMASWGVHSKCGEAVQGFFQRKRGCSVSTQLLIHAFTMYHWWHKCIHIGKPYWYLL